MNTVTSSVDELLQLAREDIARNSISSAESALEQAILIDNHIAEAFHLLGHCYSKRGKFKKAILAFQKVLDLDPQYTEAAIALSSLYNDVGRYRDGANIFYQTKQRLDQVAPGFDPRINRILAQKHYETGREYMKFERFQEAHQEFVKAFRLEPDNEQNSIQMARCLSKSGNKSAAADALRKIVAANPRSVEARIQLGIVLHSEQMLDDAKQAWQEALALNPQSQSAQMYLQMLGMPAPIANE